MILLQKEAKFIRDKSKQPHTSKGWNVFISFLVTSAIFINTHLLQFPGSVGYLMEHINGQETLDMDPSFSSGSTYERLEAFGDTGRELYMRTMLTVDLIFPLSMFLFLYLFSKYVSQYWRLKKALSWTLLSLPVVYLSLDFLENLSIFLILKNYPEQLDYLASNIGYLTTGKRLAMLFAIIIPLALMMVAKLITIFTFPNKKP